MIRDDDMFIDLRNPVDIIQHPPENRVLPNLQQWLREVPRQLPQPCRISRRYNYILHFPIAFRRKLFKNLIQNSTVILLFQWRHLLDDDDTIPNRDDQPQN